MIDDGDASGRATSAAVVKALCQLGLIGDVARTGLARFRTPETADVHRRPLAWIVPAFVMLSPSVRRP